MRSYSLEELARIVGGEIIGDRDVRIEGVAGIKEATEGEITFLANPRYEHYLEATKASAVIADRDGRSRRPILKVANPYLAFLKVVTLFAEGPLQKYPRSVHSTSIIPESAHVGTDVSIGAYVVIGDNVEIADRTTILPLSCICDDVKIGEDCLIYQRVIIRERCEIGNSVIIHSGAVIGGDGFGYAKDQNTHHKIPQIGIV
ncbi:MAG: UDP-3-O-(3-hydroxymyristoyl)glucosamine N-acyltransferase, partial [Candidatus Krumholzibacteria bacterium]|nr:UDP-3-O-(3-hydroxymyristoyl)glucosamine N-acyltransferase [Candidatus Krumholzibacteria bacterium]